MPFETLLLFGATGDLARRMLLPSLYALHADGLVADHLRIVALVEAAAHFAVEVLAPGGAFLAKVFQGGTEGELLALLKRDFTVVKHVKPAASRSGSSEMYVLATGFRRKA